MSELDEWFGPKAEPEDGEEQEADDGIIPGLRARRKRVRGGAKTPQALKRKAEDLTRYIFQNLFNAQISKSQVQEIVTDRGVFNKSTDVDFVGSMPILHNGSPIVYPIKVDAKGWAGRSFPLSRVSDNERKYFEAGLRANMGCLLSIAVWPQDAKSYGRGDVEAVYLVTWRRWLMLERALENMASGNFKGKSLRRKDLDDLSDCAIVKTSGRWVIPSEHWLSELMPKDIIQESIF